MTNLIPLQNATITQYPDSDDKRWFVRTPDGTEELGTLPETLGDKDAMSYLHFARPFELNAFNIGIKFGNERARDMSKGTEIALLSRIDVLEQQNQRLSEALERHINQEIS